MSSFDRRRFLETTGAAAGFGLLSGCLNGDDDLSRIGLNFTVPIENLGSLLDIPEIREQAENMEEEYELEVSQQASTPDSLNAMAAGEADAALVTTVSYASAVTQEAVPGNISVIATDFWDAHSDFFGFTVYSLPDSDITEPADLEGQQLAINALGTGIHAVYNRGLEQAGLDPETDVEFVELEFPTFTSALEDGRVDAALYVALFAPEPRNEGFTEVFASQDVWDDHYPFAYIAASQESLSDKDEAFRSFMADYVDIVDYVFDNRDEVIPLASDHFDIPEEVIDAFFLTEHDYYRDEIATDFDRLQFAMDEMYEMGFTDEQFDVTEYATNEYLP